VNGDGGKENGGINHADTTSSEVGGTTAAAVAPPPAVRRQDIILITGKLENCEAARDALLVRGREGGALFVNITFSSSLITINIININNN